MPYTMLTSSSRSDYLIIYVPGYWRHEKYAKLRNKPIQDPRGAPDNYGSDLTATQCVLVCSWCPRVVKSFPQPCYSYEPGHRLQRLVRKQKVQSHCLQLHFLLKESVVSRNGSLNSIKTNQILDYLARHVSENHDLQVASPFCHLRLTEVLVGALPMVQEWCSHLGQSFDIPHRHVCFRGLYIWTH